jgi:hypothetical protein
LVGANLLAQLPESGPNGWNNHAAPVRGTTLRNRVFEQSDSDGEFNSKVVRRANQNGGFIETIDQAPKIVTYQYITFKELGRARQNRYIVSGMLELVNMGSYLDYLFGRFSQNEGMAPKRLGAVLA